VLLDVLGGRPQDPGIVPEQAQSVVAPLAEQPSNAARLVIVIKVLRFRGSADSATVALRFSELGKLATRHSVRPEEVAVAAGRAVAALALAAEA